MHGVTSIIRTERKFRTFEQRTERLRKIPDILRKKILGMWLAGHTYREIQDSCHVSLATINTVKEEAKKTMPDLEDLRRLIILLNKANFNFYDTFRGAKLLDRMNDCGVSLDELDHFIKLVETYFSGNKKEPEEIIKEAIKLLKLEEKTSKPFPEIIKEDQKLTKKWLKLKINISHLQREEQSLKTGNLNLKIERKELEKEIPTLVNEKTNLMDHMSSITSIVQALKNEVLTLPCKFCGVPIPMRFPTKKEYAMLIQNHSCYRINCACGGINLISPEEVAIQIGWSILPPDREYVTLNI